MKINLTNHSLTGFLFTILLIFSGCLDRTETIHIDKHGNSTIMAEFDGKIEDYEKSGSFPTEQLWEIIEKKEYKNKENDQMIKLKAKQVIKKGNKFYSTYEQNINSDKSLQFPTELVMWKDGNKTYYEFSRTYKARKFARYNGPEKLDSFNELEEKIFNEGIFNVSESERNQYLSSLTEDIKFQNYYVFDEALGLMIRNNRFSVSLKQTTSGQIKTFFEEYITNQRLLEILKLEDSLLDKEYDNLLHVIESKVTEIISKATSIDQSKESSDFKQALNDIKYEYQITEALSSDNFVINLQMPGEIVSSNGITQFDNQNNVRWEFKGKALQDRDVPLYALSVFE